MIFRIFKIAFLAAVSAISVSTISAAVSMYRIDSEIHDLLQNQETRKASSLPVTKHDLEERMKIDELTRRYIYLRRIHPNTSKHVRIGSDKVLVQVTKCMMYEVLGLEVVYTDLAVIKNVSEDR